MTDIKMKCLWFVHVFLSISLGEDFILTDFYRNKFVQIGQDFSIYKEYDILFEENDEITNINAGRNGNNMTLYWINNGLDSFIESSSFGKSEVFDAKKKIDIQKTKISSFEISPNFSSLFFSNDEGIYKYDIKSHSTTLILDSLFVTGLTVDFFKKNIYYSECEKGKGSLKTYDYDKRGEIQNIPTDVCYKGVGFDSKNGILFAHDDKRISELMMADGSVELRYFHKDADISSMAVGIKYLFFVDFRRETRINDIYKIPKVPKPIQMILPITTSIPPHIAVSRGGLIVLDVTGGRLLRLGMTYKINEELKINVENKNVKSFKYKLTPTSEKLFWIYEKNNGKVISVEIKAGNVEGKELLFAIPNEKHLTDLELDETGENIFLAYDSSIYLGKIDDLSLKEFIKMDSEVQHMRIRPNEKVLVVSVCTESKSYLSEINYENIDELNEEPKQIKICLKTFDFDKEKNIFGSSSNTIYVINKGMDEIIKLCSAFEISSLVVYDVNVYFVASHDRSDDKKIFRIKKELAAKSQDILTEQTDPAIVAFILGNMK